MTAVSSPDLVFGEPCDLFISSVYNRAAGGSINNTIPPLLRFMRCVSDLTATVSDHANVLGNPQPPTSPFAEGVAAGDATDTAVVFWTRLPDPNAPATLEIATDPDFTNIVQTVSTSSPAGADGTVKEDVGGLSPSTVYYYRFTQGSDVSPVGRVKTAPAPTDAVPVRFAITGDANPYFRPYSVLDVLRLQDVDGWFYIGDTVYSDDDRGDGFIADQLAEYQQKHRESRVDTPLREMMRNFATYVQWDDHESVNDISGTVPAFQSRLIDGNQAFRQYFPIREDPGDPMQLYRKFQWGTSAEFYLLDLRQYRSPKIVCCEPPDPPIVEINFDPGTLGECPLGGQVILPDPACQAALADPSRTYIGTAQKQWLKNSLLSSTATFKFILNGPPITQFGMQPYDRWEAWPAERTEILDFIEANNIKNVIWLSTDFHALIASEQSVDADFAHSIPEVVVGAIGMDTILREIVSAAPSIVPLLPALPALIPQVTAYDIDRFNGAVVTVDPNASPPTATLDAYGRSGEVLLSTTFEAAP